MPTVSLKKLTRWSRPLDDRTEKVYSCKSGYRFVTKGVFAMDRLAFLSEVAGRTLSEVGPVTQISKRFDGLVGRFVASRSSLVTEAHACCNFCELQGCEDGCLAGWGYYHCYATCCYYDYYTCLEGCSSYVCLGAC